MVQGVITGSNEFRDFAADIEQVKHRIPEARERALEKTTQDFIDEVVKNIRQGSTAKGGTLNSETSPYSPGGTNDSTDSKYHIQDRSAWKFDTLDSETAVVLPKEEVEDRVNFLEEGTSDHGPTGETPMYFSVGGATIIVADKPDRDSPFYELYAQDMAVGDDPEGTLFRYGEPGEVEGVEPQRFFHEAANTIRNNNVLSRHIEREYKRIFREQFE